MERKIGENFEYDGKTVKVVKSNGRCDGCILAKKYGWCTKFTNDNGDCRHEFRLNDDFDVIFKEVTNVTHINDITDPEFPEPQMSYEI